MWGSSQAARAYGIMNCTDMYMLRFRPKGLCPTAPAPPGRSRKLGCRELGAPRLRVVGLQEISIIKIYAEKASARNPADRTVNSYITV